MKKILLFASLLPVLTFGYTQQDIDTANSLATEGLIVDQSTNPEKYRLDDTITRAEVVGTSLKLKGVTLPDDYVCQNYYTDVAYNPENNWICRAVEITADQGIVTRANARFRPQDEITRAEAMAIVSDSVCLLADGLTTFDYKTTQAWQRKVYNRFHAIEVNVPGTKEIEIEVENSGGTYTYTGDEYYPDSVATRGFIFELIQAVHAKGQNGCTGKKLPSSIYNELGISVDDSKIFNSQKVEIQSPLYGDTSYSFCYGDPLYSELEGGSVESRACLYVIERKSILSKAMILSQLLDGGVGNISIKNKVSYINGSTLGMCASNQYIAFSEKHIISFSYFCADDTFQSDINYLNINLTQPDHLEDDDVLELYYSYLDSDEFIGSNTYAAYTMRSGSDVSQEEFTSWYKDITDVQFRKNSVQDLGDHTYKFEVIVTENGVDTTYEVVSKVDLQNLKIENISSVAVN